MRTDRGRSPLLRAGSSLLTAGLLAGALTGCSVSRDDDGQAAPSPEVTETTPDASSEPEPEPTEPTETVTETVTPSPTPEAPSPTATGPEQAFLDGADLPPLNDSTSWTAGPVGAATPDAFGLCAKFDLGSIGATTTLERRFTSGADTAGQQVADFADAQTATRALKVLQAWHRDCAGRVAGRRVRVQPIEQVSVPTGSGWWYLVNRVVSGEGRWHSFGVAASGTRLSLVTMDHVGQDHNYEPGQDPVQLAVAAMAARIGS